MEDNKPHPSLEGSALWVIGWREKRWACVPDIAHMPCAAEQQKEGSEPKRTPAHAMSDLRVRLVTWVPLPDASAARTLQKQSTTVFEAEGPPCMPPGALHAPPGWASLEARPGPAT